MPSGSTEMDFIRGNGGHWASAVGDDGGCKCVWIRGQRSGREASEAVGCSGSELAN